MHLPKKMKCRVEPPYCDRAIPVADAGADDADELGRSCRQPLRRQRLLLHEPLHPLEILRDLRLDLWILLLLLLPFLSLLLRFAST